MFSNQFGVHINRKKCAWRIVLLDELLEEIKQFPSPIYVFSTAGQDGTGPRTISLIVLKNKTLN